MLGLWLTVRPAVRAMAGVAARSGVAWRLMVRLHNLRRRGHPWLRPHPFDARYGTRTGGFVPGWLLQAGLSGDAGATSFSGCQPSCLREALHSIPDPGRRIFLDLGCGKGRSAIIAGEFGFRAVVGVEVSPHLATAARRNAAVVARRHPDRPRITVVRGSAAETPLPDGDLVVFLYHSFGADVLARVIARLADAVARRGGEAWFIYENPVYGALLDAHPAFARWHAAYVACDAVEAPFQPDPGEAVVVWRAGGAEDRTAPAVSGRDRSIVIAKPGWRAVLAC